MDHTLSHKSEVLGSLIKQGQFSNRIAFKNKSSVAFQHLITFTIANPGVSNLPCISLSWLSTIQIKSDQTERLLNKPYVNEVTLTGQNPPLNCC